MPPVRRLCADEPGKIKRVVGVREHQEVLFGTAHSLSVTFTSLSGGKWEGRRSFYSERMASIGSTVAARRAEGTPARSATNTTIAAARVYSRGSTAPS